MWDLGIEDVEVLTATGRFRGHVYVKGGKIGALSQEREAAVRRVSMDGCWVFPGMIDAHVHSRDPGFPDKEDFLHTSAAAAAGGVTTLLEMPNSVPAVSTADAFRERRAYLADRAYVDYGMWGLALASTPTEEFIAMAREGACGFKFFWGYALDRNTHALVYTPEPGRDVIPPPGDGEVLELFERVAATGKVLGVHAENAAVIATLYDRYKPLTSYPDVLRVRPEMTETLTIAAAIEMARATGARLHIVHLSAAVGADLVARAAREGISVTCETCPQYLTLTDRDAAAAGPLAKVYPPIRDEENRQRLLDALRAGTIAMVASDHAPHAAQDKERPWDTAPAGVAGVETLFPLVLDLALSGAVPLDLVSQVLSERPAKLFGLYPDKGSLWPGSSADLVVVDPGARWTVRAERLHSLNPLTPWEGRTLRGVVRMTVLRGQIIWQDGRLTGNPAGQFVHAGESLSSEAATTGRAVKG